MRANGRGFRVLLRGARPVGDLGVSPDGRRLAFGEFRRAGVVVRVLDLRTRRATTIPARELEGITAATWTPGSTRLAFLRNTPIPPGHPGPAAPTRVDTIRHDGSGTRHLFQLPYDEHRGLWATALSWQPTP